MVAPLSKHSMGQIEYCTACGARLPGNAPPGICPRCELRGALELEGTVGVAFEDHPDGDSSCRPQCAFGDYEILEEIARGGMGVVYKARQKSLDRIVAVKMVLAAQFAAKSFVERFRSEAMTAAALRHPNIVRILEVGKHEGQYFFSMDYIEGPSLDRLVGPSRVGPVRAARYLHAIAEAIHYAHEAGVLHRDLKPSNVIIDLATDQPHLTDFGLAKRLDRESNLTVSLQVLGSPQFMPPEQAGGQRVGVGRTSDVYGAGAILYFLLAGRAPFEGDTLESVIKQVIEAEPIPPSRLLPSVPPDLETICLKCLEKDPHRRYPSAAALQEDLGRFLRDEPIQAKRCTPLGQGWRWCRRKPLLAGTMALAATLALVVAIGLPVETARIARSDLLHQRSLYVARMNLAATAWRDGRVDYARELLDQDRPQRGGKDWRGFEWRYLWEVTREREMEARLDGLAAVGPFSDTTLMKSGPYLLNLDRRQSLRAWNSKRWESVPISFPALSSGATWLWDEHSPHAALLRAASNDLVLYRLPQFLQVASLSVPGDVSNIAVSPNGRVLAADFATGSGVGHRLSLWNLAASELIAEVGESPGPAAKLVFSADGEKVAAWYVNHGIVIYDVAHRRTLPGPEINRSEQSPTPAPALSEPQWMEFSPDGKRLAFMRRMFGYEGLQIWDISERRFQSLSQPEAGTISTFAFSPDGKTLATAWRGERIILWDAQTLKQRTSLVGHRSLITRLAFSPDNQLLVSASRDHTARLWDLRLDREVAALGGPSDKASDAVFSDDSLHLAVLSGEGSIRVWNVPALRNRFLVGRNGVMTSSLALTPDESTLVSMDFQGALSLWDWKAGRRLWSASLGRDYVNRVTCSPDGRWAAFLSRDLVGLLNLDTRASNLVFMEGNSDLISNLSFSPDSTSVALGGHAGPAGNHRPALMLLDVRSHRLQPLVFLPEEITSLAYSRDGSKLLAGDRRGALLLLDARTGRKIDEVLAHPPLVWGITVAEDGRSLVTCGSDATVQIWRIDSGKLHRQGWPLRGHLGYVTSALLSPDGARVLSIGGDHTLRTWDPWDGIEMASLPGAEALAEPLLLSHDGTRLFTTGQDGLIRSWRIPTLAEIDLEASSIELKGSAHRP
jgi:WD40 repeat protein/tRNA A-37 threonylcarbamoyl transferase component Bud32